MVHADNPETDEIRLFAAALAHDPDGIELPYLVLDHVATRHHLADAVLVLRTGPLGPQLFSRGRAPVAAPHAASLLARPVGLYTDPDVLEPTVRAALAGICNMALGAHLLRRAGALDEASGLASRAVIESSLVRAAACGARYGWTFTAVLLTTGGEGSPDDRWAALARALRMAARVGDEIGVAGPGRALSILGNAGPDVVRPFVARVRAALSAAGDVSVDLHAATVTSPAETVDPEAIWSLLTERLDELVAPAVRELPPGDAVGLSRVHAVPAPLELALRSLPHVVSVGTDAHPSGVGYQIVVMATTSSDALVAAAARRAREHRVDAPVVVVPVDASAGAGTGRAAEADTAHAVPSAPSATASGAPASSGVPWAAPASSGNGTARNSVVTVEPATAVPTGGAPAGHGRMDAPVAPPEAPPQVSATGSPAAVHPDGPIAAAGPAVAPAGYAAPSPVHPSTTVGPPPLGPPPLGPRGAAADSTAPAGPEALGEAAGGDRITLLKATFDLDTGVSEVHLSHLGVLGTGRASVGPLAGGAQATLAALGELGVRIPYYLVSAERAHTVPGEPVVVVLAPRRAADTPGGLAPLAERIGVANGPDDVGASARATLSALNRFLSAAGACDP